MVAKLRLTPIYYSKMDYGWNVYGDIERPLSTPIVEW